MPQEERIAFARQAVAWQAEGLTIAQIAKRFDMNNDAVNSRMHKPWFKELAARIRTEEAIVDKVPERIDKEEVAAVLARAQMAKLLPKSIAFLDSCLEQDAGGKFLNRSDARYATDRVLPATGMNEPEDSRRRLGDIKLGVIMAQMAAIKKSDAKFHDVPTITVQAPHWPSPQPNLAPLRARSLRKA